MDGLWYLLGIFVLLSVLVTPFLCFNLLGRVRDLESRLEKRAATPRTPGPGPEPAAPATPEAAPRSPLSEAKRRAREEPTALKKPEMEPEAPAPQTALPKTTPDLPEPAGRPQSPPPKPPPLPAQAQPRGDARPAKGPSAPAPAPISFSWMKRLGLLPPSTEEENSNLMAWWSTRIGLVLGVIAAVFFGIHINKNTVPWVRLLELTLVAFALFGAGWWLERKLAAFGRALAAGGLALLFVAAYAAYGLPAMKVTASPLVGALAQAAVIVLTIFWSLLRGREAIFGLALVLGYVTCWFSAREGLAPIPLVSLLVLGTAGCGMFAWRGWWSGLAGALAGSGGGIVILALTQWLNGIGAPPAWIGLGSALLLTCLYVAALGAQWKRQEGLTRILLPLATSLGAFVGLAVTWTLEIEWEWFYGSFAVLFLLIGVWLKAAGSEGLWQTLWAKASVLLALLIIEKLGGPSRAFALLAEAGVLVILARPKGRIVFEIGALLAAITGWGLLRSDFDLGAITTLGTNEGFLLAYLFGALLVVVLHLRVMDPDETRTGFALALSVVIAICLHTSVLFRFDHDWGLLVAYGFALAAMAAMLPLRRLRGIEPFLATILLGALWWLGERSARHEIGWQVVSWIALAWTFYGWRSRTTEPISLAPAFVVLVASLVGIGLGTKSFFGQEWIGVALIATAALWLGVGAAARLPSLCYLALVPLIIGGLDLALSWSGAADDSVLLGGLLAAAAAWICGWFARPQMTPPGPVLLVRTAVLVLAILLNLQSRFSEPAIINCAAMLSLVTVLVWTRFKDLSLPWAGLAFTLFAGLHLLDAADNGTWHETCVVLVFVTCVANGLLLGRSGRKEPLALPKVASVLWGSGAMLAVLLGFAQRDQAAGWTTAAWAGGAVALLVTGFWFGFRGYRVIALIGLGCTILRLFLVDIQDSLWRIVAFGVTGGLLVGIGYLYHRFHQRLAGGDLDWGGDDKRKPAETATADT